MSRLATCRCCRLISILSPEDVARFISEACDRMRASQESLPLGARVFDATGPSAQFEGYAEAVLPHLLRVCGGCARALVGQIAGVLLARRAEGLA